MHEIVAAVKELCVKVGCVQVVALHTVLFSDAEAKVLHRAGVLPPWHAPEVQWTAQMMRMYAERLPGTTELYDELRAHADLVDPSSATPLPPTRTREPQVHVICCGLALCTQTSIGRWRMGHLWARCEHVEEFLTTCERAGVPPCQRCLELAHK